MSKTSSPDVNTYIGTTNFYSVLALDLASSTGYAVADGKGKIVESGTWVLTGEDHHKLGQLKQLLQVQCSLIAVAVVIERPWVRGKNTDFLFGLRGVAMAQAGALGLEFHEYAPATVKKAVTGDGHAPKETVMRFVQRLTGIVPGTDDEADAIAVALCHLNRAMRKGAR